VRIAYSTTSSHHSLTCSMDCGFLAAHKKSNTIKGFVGLAIASSR